MKRYYVDSVIEGEKQVNEVSKATFKQLKKLDGVFPLKVYKEPLITLQNENGEGVEVKGEVDYEIMEVPFTLRVE